MKLKIIGEGMSSTVKKTLLERKLEVLIKWINFTKYIKVLILMKIKKLYPN